MYYTVIKHDGHLRTQGEFKTQDAAVGFFINLLYDVDFTMPVVNSE